MDRFRTYCTSEQTKKAIELGAPILVTPRDFYEDLPHFDTMIEGENASIILPTAEEMIGWLEQQEDILAVCIRRDYGWFYQISLAGASCNLSSTFHSRKEATLAAINAALDYLNNNK